MIIEEPDFKIVDDEKYFTLHVLKNKSELKKDTTDKFKVKGYYVMLDAALKAAVIYRQGKKYPGKEKQEPLLKSYRKYIEIKSQFDNLLNGLYKSISKLKLKTYEQNKNLCN